MDYIVNQVEQIAVTADTPKEAISKVIKGEGLVISVNYSAMPRPQPLQMTGVAAPGGATKT